MAKRQPNNAGRQVSNRPDASFYEGEREREGCHVHGEADLLYGEVSGFRYDIEHTGDAHRLSALGRKVKR